MNEALHTTTSDPTTETSETPQARRQGLRWGNIFIWGVVLAVLAVLGWGMLNLNKPRPEAGEPAPFFEAQFYSGYEWEDRPVASLDDLSGKVVVINFWASWCVECHLEAELLEAASRRYQDQDVVFLGLAYVDAEPNSLAYLDEYQITYPNAPDLRQQISDRYEITGVPETFFIGKDGIISEVWIGPVTEELLYSQIDTLLAQ
jgi:cytochrome c biogenesis protein CcmG/thiol:disulfide interchange protein DsbE